MADYKQRNVAASREEARAALSLGDLTHAERIFGALLDSNPTDSEALQFIAARYLNRGDAGKAVQLLRTAAFSQPNHAAILHQLGVAEMASEDFSGAVGSLRQALAIVPNMYVARLRLALALERLGEEYDALVAYVAAINSAQGQDRWLDDATTAPGLREAVKHAVRIVNVGRRELFDRVLAPLRKQYGQKELNRTEQCLAIYLGERTAEVPDSRQRPKFLYFPGIPSRPYYSRERFTWQAELESNLGMIRCELDAVLTQSQSLEPFLQTRSADALKDHLRASGNHSAAWDAHFFYRHGERHDPECAQCPLTTALIETLPLVRIRDHAPETLFSVLRPGTHILPHQGVTNTRLVTHLPLIVPSDCAINVGGELHVWQEGRCVTFDDTFEHEAWNRSSETRVVLILDSWNPDLTDVECAAVTYLVEAIGDFNRDCEVIIQ